MKQKQYILILSVLMILAFVGQAEAQRRTSPKPAPTPVAQKADLAEATRLTAEQVKRLNRFIYILGGVADGIEKVDEEIRQGKASRAAIDQNDRNKDAMMQSIRNLRAGIVSLEVDFKSKEHLRIYSGSISGITQMMGVAEDQVGEGRVRDAGRTLLSISERLVDTIAAIP